MTTLIWTAPLLVNWIKQELENRSIGKNHRLEAELLVCAGLQINRIDLYLQFDRPLNKTECSQVRDLVKRRFHKEPIAYIIGSAHFWNLELKVGPGVLIPRSDTEVLVEFLINTYPGTKPVKALEFGIGSGAISLAWATETKQVHIDGLEISPKAFEWAQINLGTYQKQIAQKHSSVQWYLGRPISALAGPYDVIVSNPPYITEEEMSQLEPDVVKFEPSIALRGGIDGLEFYRLLFQEGLRLLSPTGILVFEHGYTQKQAILTLMPKGFKLLCAKKDLNRQDRMLAFVRQPSE